MLPLALVAAAALATPVAPATFGGGAAATLRVGASPAVASCVEEAAAGWDGRSRTLVSEHQAAAGAFDVFVGADVEITRLVESGAAVEGSERALPPIPWVLSGAPDLAALEQGADEVAVLGGAAGYEARRRLAGSLRERLRPSLDAQRLRGAAARVVPASLRGGVAATALDWPPLRASVVVLSGAADAEAAADLAAFLSEGAGRESFGACAGSPAP